MTVLDEWVYVSSDNMADSAKVANARVSLIPSSITWYCPKGGDALQLGR